jgi:dolichyl-phosphate beta-glucosyltransferase
MLVSAASPESTEDVYLSVVIPAYNEAKRLPVSLGKLADYVEKESRPIEVVVVDDGSEDETAAIIKRFAVDHPGFRLIQNPHKGKGYAVRTGVLAARGRHILFSDADLATPIERAADLVQCLNGKGDVAIGSREGLTARRIGEPAYRHLMGRVFNSLVRFVAVGGIQDTQCGFKCFKREAAQDIFRRVCLYGDDSPVVKGGMVTGFDVEVLFLARKVGYSIREVPVEWYHQQDSKVNPIRDSLRMFADVVKVRINDWRGLYR